MGLQFKMDVLSTLNAMGYTAYRLRKEKLLGESTIQRLRENSGVSWDNIGTLCALLKCQPGDLLEYVEE